MGKCNGKYELMIDDCIPIISFGINIDSFNGFIVTFPMDREWLYGTMMIQVLTGIII